MPILRNYRVHVDPARVEAYETFERDVGVPMVTRQEGCVQAGFARVVEGDANEYVFWSLWDSQDSLDAAMRGDDWKQAVARFEAMGAVQGEARTEHWDVVAHARGAKTR